MQNFLNWLNGKKTAIGAALLLVLSVLSTLGVKVPTVQESAVEHWIALICQYGGYFLVVVGIIHKALKGDFSGVTAAISDATKS